MRQRERIEAISELPLENTQKALLALLVLNKKPVIRLDIRSYKGVKPHIFFADISKIFKWIFVDYFQEGEDEWGRIATYYVSDSFIKAKYLQDMTRVRYKNSLEEEEIPREVHIAYGVMLGYPSTAIGGYARNELLPVQDYPEKFKDSLFTFQLSQKNYANEVQIAMSWLEVLREQAPEIAKLARERFSSIVTVRSKGFEEG